MIPGANLSFKFRLTNPGEPPTDPAARIPIKHADFLDVIVYVYVYADKVVKFSKSERYENRLTAIDDYYLKVDLSPEQTRSLGEGVPKFSVYTAVAATGYPNGKIVAKGAGNLLAEPLVFNPISEEL